MGELRPAKGISLSFNKTVGRAGRTNSTIKKPRSQKRNEKLSKKWGIVSKSCQFHTSYYSFSLVWICEMEFNLLSIIFCTKVCVYTDFVQYNTITLFKEGSAITYYSFLTYGPQTKNKQINKFRREKANKFTYMCMYI